MQAGEGWLTAHGSSVVDHISPPVAPLCLYGAVEFRPCHLIGHNADVTEVRVSLQRVFVSDEVVFTKLCLSDLQQDITQYKSHNKILSSYEVFNNDLNSHLSGPILPLAITYWSIDQQGNRIVCVLAISYAAICEMNPKEF